MARAPTTAIGLTPAGKKVFDKQLPNTEPKLRQVFDKLHEKFGTVLVIVNQPASIGALPLTVARDTGCNIAYLPGLSMRRIADLYPGEAKIDARDAAVIADTARTMLHTPPALRHVLKEPQAKDGALAYRKVFQARLRSFTVDDDVVGALEYADGVGKTEGVVGGREIRVKGESAVTVDGLETVPDLVLGQARVGGDGPDSGYKNTGAPCSPVFSPLRNTDIRRSPLIAETETVVRPADVPRASPKRSNTRQPSAKTATTVPAPINSEARQDGTSTSPATPAQRTDPLEAARTCR